MADKTMDWLEKVEEPKTEVLPAEVTDEQKALVLQQAEDQMLTSALSVVGGAMDFIELDPEDLDAMPEGWVEMYGEKEAIKRHRAAKYGLMGAKEAPVAMKMATSFATGSLKARALEKGGSKTLNITMVEFKAPQRYDEEEVDE